MRAVKGAVLLIACLAVVASMAPVVAHALTPQNPTGPGDPSGSGGGWKVTCTYDAQERFRKQVIAGSKVCVALP